MYALIENGEITRINIELPVSIGNSSIPRGATGLEAFGLYAIEGDEPAYDPARQRLSGPQYQFDGSQVNRVFAVEQIPDSERAGQVRAERNEKLKASDWTQVLDAPVQQQAWQTYRQALRDITAQPGFPWTITWPTEP